MSEVTIYHSLLLYSYNLGLINYPFPSLYFSKLYHFDKISMNVFLINIRMRLCSICLCWGYKLQIFSPVGWLSFHTTHWIHGPRMSYPVSSNANYNRRLVDHSCMCFSDTGAISLFILGKSWKNRMLGLVKNYVLLA